MMHSRAKHTAAYAAEVFGMVLFFGVFLAFTDPRWALISALCVVLIGLEWDAPA